MTITPGYLQMASHTSLTDTQYHEEHYVQSIAAGEVRVYESSETAAMLVAGASGRTIRELCNGVNSNNTLHCG